MYVKAFAAQQGVTVQAVYKLIRKHADQLQEHVTVGNEGKYLDDFAMDYLRGRMQSNAQVELYDDAKDIEINALNERLVEMQKRLDQKDIIIDRLQQRYDDKLVRIEQLEQDLRLIENTQGEQISQAVAAAEDVLRIRLENEHRIILEDKTQEFQQQQRKQIDKIDELEGEIDRRERLIEELQAEIEAEAQKTRWQRFKAIWRKQ